MQFLAFIYEFLMIRRMTQQQSKVNQRLRQPLKN